MFRLVLILIITTCLIFIKNTKACTAFCLQSGSDYYLSKNLDWSIEDGYVFLNEKNVRKSILITELFSKNEFNWTSKYRSLTFNQFGKEFPLGGINENGLVIEELNTIPVKSTLYDSIKYFNEFQLTQYLLDNCRSTKEVVAQLSKFQYKPLIQSLHYLLADKTGNILIVEFNGENFNFHFANDTNVPVLSNNNYEESLHYLAKFNGFGGDLEVKNRPGSNERFVYAAHCLKSYKNENPVKYSFQVLNLVKQDDTKWSIVYDITNLAIHFQFHNCKSKTTFDFKTKLSQPTLNSLGCDITQSNPEFSMITSDLNTALLQNVFTLLSQETGKEVDYNLLYKMAIVGNQHLEESTNDKIVTELNKVIKKLPGTKPLDYTDKAIQNVAEWQNYNVIALGEATHGTKEFCELKHRLFRFLVENYSYKILAYEYSFRKSIAINDYVLKGEGNIDSILQNESWIQNNAEVKELINWMREYNKCKPSNQKIQFIGIDNQDDAYSPGFVIEYIQKYFPEFSTTRKSTMDQIRQLNIVSYNNISDEEFLNRKKLFTQLEKQLETYFNTIENCQGQYQRQNALRLIKAVNSSHEFLYRLANGKNNRDALLAETVMQLINDFSENKMVVWAHNAHVANNPDYYGLNQPAMGWYLRKALGNKYYTIATSFSKGNFKAVMLDENGNDTKPLTCEIKTEPPSVSVNNIFKSVNQNFVLKTESIKASSVLYYYLNKKRPMIGIGDLYLGEAAKHFTNDRIVNLIESYNLIFYFSYTHAITVTS